MLYSAERLAMKCIELTTGLKPGSDCSKDYYNKAKAIVDKESNEEFNQLF